MSLLFNTLCRFFIAFLTRSNRLLISWLQSPSSVIFEPKNRKSATASTFPLSVSLEKMGPDAMIFFFFFFNIYKPAFSFYSFTLIKGFFISSSLSAIRVVSSSGYLKSLVFHLPILIPTCNSSTLAFLMMCSAYKLNKHSDNIQPCPTPFSIPEPISCSTQGTNCCFLTRIQISQESGKMVWYSHLFRTFHSSLWSTQSRALALLIKPR